MSCVLLDHEQFQDKLLCCLDCIALHALVLEPNQDVVIVTASQ